MEHTKSKSAVAGIVGAILVVALVVLGVAFFRRIVYELHQPFTWDTTLYIAVGRGILNGLMPYKDLYENKPPGIFLMTALSLWLTGDMSLGYVLQAVAIIGIPIVLVVLSLWLFRRSQLLARLGMVAIASIFGMLLGLYTDERSGAFQVESFGAFFTVLYLGMVCREPELRGWRLILASGALLCAVGLKEPFMLSALAGVLLLYADEPWRVVRAYITPLSIAGGLGIVGMAGAGYLWPYLSIYLPEMIGRHIFMGGSPFARGMEWNIILDDLHAYSPFLSLAVVALLIAVAVEYLWGQRWQRCAAMLASMTVGLFLLTFAVGIGGQFYNHHFVFAVPGYAALFLGLMRKVHKGDTLLEWRVSLRNMMMILPVLALIPAAFVQPPYDLQARLLDARQEEDILVPLGRQIDEVLDRCGIDRYVFLGANGPQPYAHTRHSPEGPLFYQYNYLLGRDRARFRREFFKDLLEAQFIVFRSWEVGDLRETVDAYLREHFGEEPWSCAQGIHLSQASYRFLWRKL